MVCDVHRSGYFNIGCTEDMHVETYVSISVGKTIIRIFRNDSRY